ncbi:hypothetical protein [Streptomyces goshikiensis]|uniref:hypothetical protein n=1 Tax=Streptomyces goshikiensis TaxID=1942 RepID=UPI0036CD1FB7
MKEVKTTLPVAGRSVLLEGVRELVADRARRGYGKAELIRMIEEARTTPSGARPC